MSAGSAVCFDKILKMGKESEELTLSYLVLSSSLSAVG